VDAEAAGALMADLRARLGDLPGDAGRGADGRGGGRLRLPRPGGRLRQRASGACG
jgi:hypothetical protein